MVRLRRNSLDEKRAQRMHGGRRGVLRGSGCGNVPSSHTSRNVLETVESQLKTILHVQFLGTGVTDTPSQFPRKY